MFAFSIIIVRVLKDFDFLVKKIVYVFQDENLRPDLYYF